MASAEARRLAVVPQLGEPSRSPPPLPGSPPAPCLVPTPEVVRSDLSGLLVPVNAPVVVNWAAPAGEARVYGHRQMRPWCRQVGSLSPHRGRGFGLSRELLGVVS